MYKFHLIPTLKFNLKSLTFSRNQLEINTKKPLIKLQNLTIQEINSCRTLKMQTLGKPKTPKANIFKNI